MRWYLALTIGSLFIFIHQGSATNSSDICTGIIANVDVGHPRILTLSVDDNVITSKNNCSCEIMIRHPVIYLCLFKRSAPCTQCSSDECLSADVDSTNTTTCISISIDPINPQTSDGNGSCPNSTNFIINLSMKSSSNCSGGNSKSVFVLKAIGSCPNNTKEAFLKATCHARHVTTAAPSATVISSAWSSWPASSTKTTTATHTTSRSWHTGGWDSTEMGNTPPSSTSLAPAIWTEVYSSTVQNGTSSDKSADKTTSSQTSPNTVYRGPSSDTSADQTTSSQSSLTTEMIIGIGVGIGVACGVLLIIAIIVIFIIRKRRAGYNKHHITNSSQTIAADPSQNPYTSFTNPDSAAYDNATTDTASSYQLVAYTSYTEPASAAYDNATTITELNYPIAANDHNTVGEANYEYTEVKQPEAISSPNSHDDSTTEIGRNEAYSTINAMGNNYDNVNENTSTKLEQDMTLIDNELYG